MFPLAAGKEQAEAARSRGPVPTRIRAREDGTSGDAERHLIADIY